MPGQKEQELSARQNALAVLASDEEARTELRRGGRAQRQSAGITPALKGWSSRRRRLGVNVLQCQGSHAMPQHPQHPQRHQMPHSPHRGPQRVSLLRDLVRPLGRHLDRPLKRGLARHRVMPLDRPLRRRWWAASGPNWLPSTPQVTHKTHYLYTIKHIQTHTLYGTNTY
jgi:hypothetical protein